MIRTRIFEVDGKDADHNTSTTALKSSVKYRLSEQLSHVFAMRKQRCIIKLGYAAKLGLIKVQMNLVERVQVLSNTIDPC